MIKVKTLVFNNFQVNTCILYAENKDAIIVDPACSNESETLELTNYIEENNLQVKKIINTHAHIDHIVGVPAIANYFKVPFYLHQEDLPLLQTSPQMAELFGFDLSDVKLPDAHLKEGDNVDLAGEQIKILHVPGHSPGSIVLYSEMNKFAIVGDVLFAGSVGRSDLPGGNHDVLISGIKNKLMVLPGDTVVYAGHGPTTTIKQEHDTNPFIN